MSRIENSDDQRIREMMEAQHREKTDREKRDQSEKVQRSFGEVMAQRGRANKEKTEGKQAAQSERAQKRSSEAATKEKKPLLERGSAQLERAAVLARHAAGQMGEARTQLAEKARQAESSRVDELEQKGADAKDGLEREVRRDDLREVERDEQRFYEVHLGGPAIDPDAPREDRRRERGGGESSGEGEAGPKGVAAAEGPRAAQVVKIPHEVIDAIAKAVQVAVDKSGGTEVRIDLKGTLLDGVTLKVSAKKGKVRCVFENCDRNLGNLIESSKGELMRHLAKRGLELDILRVGR